MSSASVKSHVEQGENGMGSRSYSCALAAEQSRLIGHHFLTMLLSFQDFRIGMIIALCHISGICLVESDRLKILLR